MNRHTKLPRLNRTDFYRFQEEDLLTALSQAIAAHAAANPGVELTTEQEAVLAWGRLVVDVLNGGFTQFFYNHRGERGVEPVARLLEALGIPKASAVLDEAAAVYRHPPRADGEQDGELENPAKTASEAPSSSPGW